MIQNVMLLGMLGICTIEDIRKREVCIYPVMLFGIAGIVMHLYYRNLSIYNLLAGIGVGVFLLLISKLTRGKVGEGDGVVLIASGIYLGFWENTRLLLHGLLFCGICSLILLVCKKKKGTDEIPFIPFLLAAYLEMILL